MDEFVFENPSEVVESFCRAYLETDCMEFALYALEIIRSTIKNNDENAKEK